MSYPTGVPIPPLEPGSPTWMKTISASKIPAIMGVSPFESKFSLWHRMAGNVGKFEGNSATSRGTYLEAAVLGWFFTENPEIPQLHVDTRMGYKAGYSFHHPEHEDWTAAPDAVAVINSREHVGVEAKTSQYADEWGTEGTAEIPPYYLAQVAWQMIVCGFEKVYVPVLFGSPFEFRLYVVTWADIETDAQRIIASVIDFQASLESNTPPDLDGSMHTYIAVRELHPEIDGETVELVPETAAQFIRAKHDYDAAEIHMNFAKSTLADEMGNAKTATWGGVKIAGRQAKNGGTPYIVAARKLPTLEEAK